MKHTDVIKHLKAFITLLLLFSLLSANPNSQLMITSSIIKYRNNYNTIYDKPADPRIGVEYSFPIKYEFIHLGITSDYSFRNHFLQNGDVDTFIVNDISEMWIRQEVDRWGNSANFGISPKVVLKKLMFGFDYQWEMDWVQYTELRNITNLETNTSVDKKYKDNWHVDGNFRVNLNMGFYHKRFSVITCFNYAYGVNIKFRWALLQRKPKRYTPLKQI